MAAFDRPLERPESQLCWRNQSSQRVSNIFVAVSTPHPKKNPFSYTPQTCHPPRSAPCRLLFRSVDPPLPSAAPASAVLLHLGCGKNKFGKDASRMSFINLHSMQLRDAAAGLLHLAVQHHPG